MAKAGLLFTPCLPDVVSGSKVVRWPTDLQRRHLLHGPRNKKQQRTIVVSSSGIVWVTADILCGPNDLFTKRLLALDR
jgi:hypothetical protein